MSTTLEIVDRAVETPIPRARRRRFWLVWWLWGIFGTAFSMRGVPDGTWLAVALLLTSPFWALFAVWPILWIRDRLRAKRFWAESVSVVLAASPSSSTEAQGEKAEPEEDIALPVVVGQSGVLVPVVGWMSAFPTLDEARLAALGVKGVPAETFAGVHLASFKDEDLIETFLADNALCASDCPGASVDDLLCAQRWCAALKLAIDRSRAA